MSEIKDIPKHWEIKKLGEVCNVLDNLRKPINSAERQQRIAGKGQDELFPYYGATGQVGWIDDFLTDGEFILIGEDGAPFLDIYKDKAYKIKGKTWVNNHAHILKAKEQFLLDDYALYYLNSINYREFVNGTTRLKLTKSSLVEIPFVVPPLPEQQAIVAKIEELLSELENGKQQLLSAQQQLKVYRQSLLKWAFEGKLTNKNVKEGELPSGWKTEILGLVCEIKNGKNQKLVENPNGKYPIYGSAGKMGFADSYLCDAGSTIVGRKGTINKPLYVNEKFWNVDTAFGFMPNTDLITHRFLYFFCLSFNFAKLDKSTTIPSLAKTDLQKIEVVLPPLNEQELIVSVLESKLTVCDKIDETISQSLQQAETLKQSILKKAFEGKLVHHTLTTGVVPHEEDAAPKGRKKLTTGKAHRE
jgi:type I restriction enzyme S subunit